MHSRLNVILPYFCLLTLFAAAVVFRPLLPVDETRYMTVAWEMYLKKSYFLPTLNFVPYHHKPPMLFWLINIVWNVFGVSRWAGLVPIFAAASSVIFLTQKLAADLFPANERIARMVPWMMLGSFPFLIYGTLVMFDLMVSAIVLSTILTFRSHAIKPHWLKVFAAGILMGAGVLTKGPVAYLYILSCLLFYPFWKSENARLCNRKYYLSLALALLLSTLPVLIWLIPTLSGTNQNFAFWLLWEQTAGRITGNFSAAHVRPVYFYLAILPALFLPWIIFPSFWTCVKDAKHNDASNRFLLSATLTAFLCFSLISGKQPHYILPLLPYIVIFMARFSLTLRLRTVQKTSILLVVFLIAGQAYASGTYFKKYDITPFADFYALHHDKDWAFVRNYQGQMGFLARSEKHIASLQLEEVADWMKNHPDGYVVIRYNPAKERLDQYQVIMTKPHKEKMLSIVQGK